MGNITGLIVAILVAVLGFFGWKSLDSRIGELQSLVAASESDTGSASRLLQRIEAVESANSSAQQVDMAPLLGRIEALESAGQVTTPDNSAGSDGAPSQALQQRLATVEQAIDSIARDFGEEVLNPLVARMDALESAIGVNDGAVESGAEDSLKTLVARLESVESRMAELSVISEQRNTTDESSASNNADLDGADMGQYLAPMEARLAAVESAVDSLPSVSNLNEALSQRIGNLESTVGGIQSTIESEALAPLVERIETVETTVAAIEPGVGQQSLVPLMQRIQEVEKAVGGAIATAGTATDENLIAGGFEFVDSEIVYFGYNSASLSDDGLNGLKRFSEKITPTSKIVIRGYADSRGSNIYNQNLALRRALNTEKVLVGELRARNIYRNQIIALESAGEESQLVETGDNVENAKNRAVKITLYE